MSRKSLRALLALLAALATFVATLVDDPGDPTPAGREFVTLPAPGPDVVADTDNEQQVDELNEALPDKHGPIEVNSDHDGVDLHEDTRDETPPGVTPSELKAGAEQTRKLQRTVALPPQMPAGAQNYRCHDRPVRNQSALAYPQRGVSLHFTVSDPGSLWTIRGLFDTRSFGASSNAGWDWAAPRGEYCHIWVRFGRKAWAQGAANSAYYSIEIHTKDRSRASWIHHLRDGKLAAFVRDIALRTGAPLKLVDPVGCVFPPGLTDHDRLECGNTHWDVGKNFPWDFFLRQVRAGVAPRFRAIDTTRCKRINYWRHAGRPKGGPWERKTVWRKRELAKRGITCTPKGPARR